MRTLIRTDLARLDTEMMIRTFIHDCNSCDIIADISEFAYLVKFMTRLLVICGPGDLSFLFTLKLINVFLVSFIYQSHASGLK